MPLPSVTANVARSIPLPKDQDLGAVEQIAQKSISVTSRNTIVLVNLLAGASLLTLAALVYVVWRKNQSEDKPPQEPEKQNQLPQNPQPNQISQEPPPQQKKKPVYEPVSEPHLKMAHEIFPNYPSKEMQTFLSRRGIKHEQDIQALWDHVDALFLSIKDELEGIPDRLNVEVPTSASYRETLEIVSKLTSEIDNVFKLYEKCPFLFRSPLNFFRQRFSFFSSSDFQDHKKVRSFVKTECFYSKEKFLEKEMRQRALELYLKQENSSRFWLPQGSIYLADFLQKYPQIDLWHLPSDQTAETYKGFLSAIR